MQIIKSFISNIPLPFLRKHSNEPELKINVYISESTVGTVLSDYKSDDDLDLGHLYNFNPEDSDLKQLLKQEQLVLKRSGSLVLLTQIDQDKEINVNSAIIQERNKEIKQLTRDLDHLQEMLSELNKTLGIQSREIRSGNVFPLSQGEQLEKVESNVQIISVNTEQSVAQLDSAVKENVDNNALIEKIIAGSLATVGVVGTIALIIIFI